MSSSVMLEVPLELEGKVEIEVSPNGGVKVLGARKVVAVYQVKPTPQRDGDSKEVVVVSESHGHAVEVVFERIAGSYWVSRGLARPSYAAVLQKDGQTVEVSSIDCEGKEKHVLGVVPPRAALARQKGAAVQ